MNHHLKRRASQALLLGLPLALLTTVGIVGYKHHMKAARESVLKEDLFQLNHALEQYKADRGKYPTSIGQLRELQYLR